MESTQTKKAPKALWYRFIAFVARWLVYFPLGGVKISGSEHVPRSGPVLIAPIHVSHFDPPLLGSMCPRELRFMAKEELFKNPMFGWLIRSVGAFPVKRGEGDTGAIRQTLAWLKEGRAVLVFPEGQRGDAVTLGAMLPGIAVLAKKSGAPVLPVGIYGTHIIMPKGEKRFHRCRVRLVYGEPITYAMCSTSDDEKVNRQSFLKLLAEKIVATSHEAGLEIKISESGPVQTTSLPSRTPSSEQDPETV